MLVDSFVKQPGETLRRTMSYDCRIDVGQTVMAVAVNHDSDISVLAFIDPTGRMVEYFVSGGLDNKIYIITMTATISDGQVMEDEVECYVEEV